jgi:hypothetical protein
MQLCQPQFVVENLLALPALTLHTDHFMMLLLRANFSKFFSHTVAFNPGTEAVHGTVKPNERAELLQPARARCQVPLRCQLLADLMTDTSRFFCKGYRSTFRIDLASTGFAGTGHEVNVPNTSQWQRWAQFRLFRL